MHPGRLHIINYPLVGVEGCEGGDANFLHLALWAMNPRVVSPYGCIAWLVIFYIILSPYNTLIWLTRLYNPYKFSSENLAGMKLSIKHLLSPYNLLDLAYARFKPLQFSLGNSG